VRESYLWSQFYAKKAHVLIPALDEYERKMAAAADAVIVPMTAVA
jgi:hypothetical protein